MGAGASHGKASGLLPFISTGAAAFVLKRGTPKNSPDVCRRLTLSAKSRHSVGRTVPKASFLTGTAGPTWGLLTVPPFFQSP